MLRPCSIRTVSRPNYGSVFLCLNMPKNEILTRKEAAELYLTQKRTLWDEYENIFFGKPLDQGSLRSKSQVFDHKLSTLVMDRAARVMAQIQTGKVKAISKNDEGASRLMNLILDKYVIPNAKSQFDFLTKCRMVDLYSNIYGSFFVLVDWDIRENGYAGPDMWLLPIRDVFPQVGATSIQDSDYIIVRTWQPLSWFKQKKKDKNFKNMDKVYTILKDKAGDMQSKDSGMASSQREDNEYPSKAQEAKGKGYYEVLTCYERDKWTDYVPSADMEIRDRKNPHEDGELPVICKYSIPLIDDFMGLGDFERGKSMQYATNSLWNLYMDSVKVSIFPPTLINKDNIADASTIKWGAAARWLVKNNVGNAAQVLPLSPQGTQTFNNVYQVVTSSLLNMMGSTDTAVAEKTDPGFGKTPQALKMQAARENARDNVDRFYMEQFLTAVGKKFVNLLSKKQSSAIKIRMFEDEIQELANQYPDIEEMWDEKTGNLQIDKSRTGSIMYDYEVVPGSTYAVDQEQQQQNLMSFLQLLMQNAQMGQQGITSPMIEALKAEGKTPKLGELITRILSNSGITDWDNIIVDEGKNQNPQMIADQMGQIFDQQMQQMMGMGQIPETPMGGMNGGTTTNQFPALG